MSWMCLLLAEIGWFFNIKKARSSCRVYSYNFKMRLVPRAQSCLENAILAQNLQHIALEKGWFFSKNFW